MNEGINFLQTISPEEELRSRREKFKMLKQPGILASFYRKGEKAFIIFLKKLKRDKIEVIELTEGNIDRIRCGRSCYHSELHFDDLYCLNIHQIPTE